MHGIATEFAAVFDGRLEFSPELLFSPWKGCCAPFAGISVARLGIEQNHLKAVLLQLVFQKLRRPMVGHLKFDGSEADVGGQGKSIEKRHFIEHVVQVRSEFGHRSFPCLAITPWRCSQCGLDSKRRVEFG